MWLNDRLIRCSLFSLFFNDTATTEIYTLSLHDALPICEPRLADAARTGDGEQPRTIAKQPQNIDELDRKSTRLNSSHGYISYAVFCLKKKKYFPLHKNTQKTSFRTVEEVEIAKSHKLTI